MPFFIINPKDIYNKQVTIKGSDAHHIQRVLRLGPGSRLTLFDGVGNEYDALIIGQDSRKVVAEILNKQSIPPALTELTLIQCLPRLDKMDLIVQKAVELGVYKIIPAKSQRSRTIQAERLVDKQKRWQRIAVEAAKQCGQSRIPVVEEVQALSGLLEKGGLSVVLWEEEKDASLRKVLNGFKSDKITLLVGPEGGLTVQEIGMLQSKGWRSAGLGSRVLRLETAAIVGVGIIQYELGELSP